MFIRKKVLEKFLDRLNTAEANGKILHARTIEHQRKLYELEKWRVTEHEARDQHMKRHNDLDGEMRIMIARVDKRKKNEGYLFKRMAMTELLYNNLQGRVSSLAKLEDRITNLERTAGITEKEIRDLRIFAKDLLEEIRETRGVRADAANLMHEVQRLTDIVASHKHPAKPKVQARKNDARPSGKRPGA